MQDPRRRGAPKTDIERAASHFGVALEHVTPEMIDYVEGIPRGSGLNEGDIREIGYRAAEEVMARIREREHESLMLHSVPYAFGSPGIVVNETVAKASPCRCVEYKPSKLLCWSPGIVGALTDEQEGLYCPSIEKIERPGTVERMTKWQEAVDACKAEIASIPEAEGERRVTTWLRCMSRELTLRGIEA